MEEKKMRIAICDDNKEIIEQIKRILSAFYSFRKLPSPPIDSFLSGDSLLSDLTKKDIVFIDVEMPGLNGILTGQKLLERNKNTILIMVTSYDRYLDDAFRINAFRYISKPIDADRLIHIFTDAIATYNTILGQQIVVSSSKSTCKYNSSDIVMLEMDGRKVTLHTTNECIVTDKSLKEWAELLPESSFFACNRGFIVNLSHIKKITSDKIIMDKDGLEAYLTKRKHAEIKKRWLLYIESIS